MMAFAKYDILTEDLANGLISWPDDTVTAYLTSRQPSPADVVLSDAQPLSSNYYAPTPLTGKAVAQGDGGIATLRASPLQIKTFGGPVTFQFIVFVDATNGNRLMLWIGFDTAPTFAPATLTVGQAAQDGLFDLCTLQ